MESKFLQLLKGGDLRSTGRNSEVISKIKDQESFEHLFALLYSNNRIVVMRAADAIEKITNKRPAYLFKHKKEVLDLSKKAIDKELKWHLAQLIPRLSLSADELSLFWEILSNWLADKNESKIVRVNSLDSLFQLSQKYKSYINKYEETIRNIKNENIPSLNARIKKLKLSS